MQNKAILENNNIYCLIDSTGVLLELIYKTTGASLIQCGKNMTGWKIITNLGRWREHPVFDVDNDGHIDCDGTTATIAFHSLCGKTAILDYDMQIIYTLEHDGELRANIRIVNNSNETLREIWFPFISGVRTLDADIPHHLIFNSSTGMIIDDPLVNLPVYDGYTFNSRTNGEFMVGQFMRRGMGRYPLIYPGNACMPWIDYYNNKQGWYLGYHDMETPSTAMLIRKRQIEGDIQLGFCRYPMVKPGQSWTSGDYVIRPHAGEWHDGAKRYVQFAKNKIQDGQMPPWMRDLSGFRLVLLIDQSRGIQNDYDFIYDQFKKDRKNGVDLPILVFGWVRRGFDNGYPELDPDERIGGAGKLKEVISKVRSEGGHVLLYTQGRLIDMCTDYFKGPGSKCAYKSEDGVPYTDEYLFYNEATLDPNRKFALACPSTDEWKRQLLSQIDTVMELGANGILFDQMGADVPYICFDETHNHSSPDMAADGKIELLRILQDYAEKKDPGFAIVSELICDVFLQHLDFTHGFETQNSSFYNFPGWLRANSAIYRYTFPTHRPTCRFCESKNEFSEAFVNGLLFEHNVSFSVKEETKAEEIEQYLYSLERLWQNHAGFFNSSRFLDNEGIWMQSEGILAKRFDGGETQGITIANFRTEENKARFSIQGCYNDAHVYKNDGSEELINIINNVIELTMDGESAALILLRT